MIEERRKRKREREFNRQSNQTIQHIISPVAVIIYKIIKMSFNVAENTLCHRGSSDYYLHSVQEGIKI